MLWQRRLIVVLQKFDLPLAIIEDLQKEHPAKLFETLRVAVGSGVLAHDVLDGFHNVRNVGHRLGSFLIEGRFEFSDSGQIVILSPEQIDDFDGRSKVRQWIDFKDFERLQTLNAAIGILVEQRFEHSPDACAILGKDMPLLDLVGSLTAREWWLVKCNMADEVKGVIVSPHLLRKLIQKHATA